MITAEDILRKYNIVINKANTKSYTIKSNCQKALIEFAKIHVEAALKKASINSKISIENDWGTFENKEENSSTKIITVKNSFEKNTFGHGDCTYEIITVDKESILNSYPLNLIK